MTDDMKQLVERLRDARIFDASWALQNLCIEAAYAIERLTAAPAAMASSPDPLGPQSERPLIAARQGAAPECKCDLRTKLVGDGCEVCNPELAKELAAPVAAQDVDSIMALADAVADGAIQSDAKEAAAKAALRAAVEQMRDAALEEAAKMCEMLRADLSKGQGDCVNQYDCAAAIRALKGKA